ncbi:MAG: type II secretion system F family protein [Clostridia bacterium]|nr:type II secretion system F family protein [Clostridia bacterium]
MPLYRCTVLNALGEKQHLTRQAGDEVSLRAELKKDKFYPMKVTLIKEKKKSEFFAVSSKVKPDEVIGFLRQFSVMVKAGIPIGDSINSLRQQKYTTPFKNVLQAVYFDIESGVLLSEAFAKHPKVFPRFFISMVAIGEASGSLDRVLASMADYYENDRKIKKKAKSSMVYPVLLLVMVFAVLLFVTLFVLPQFESTINELGGDVPKITRILMDISQFMQDYIFIILPILAVLLLAIFLFFKTKKGEYVKDFLLFHMPLIGKVQQNLITSRFSKAFVILLGSGMNMVDCLENLKRMLGNAVFSQKFSYTIEEVKRGRRIAPSLAATGLFPTMLTEMIDVGEKSGNIEEVLTSTSSYFDECVESSIAKAIAALEPMMILILGVIVAVVILSVLLPMMSLMNTI